MNGLPVNVAVFFGNVHLVGIGRLFRGLRFPVVGPFETKTEAVEDANQAAVTEHGWRGD
jgi:hypothetical protein